MTNHELKTWLEPWAAVADGTKRYEVRIDDRGFAVGDVLKLHEWDHETKSYTGRSLIGPVTYLTHGPAFGLPPDMVVMSLGAMCRADAALDAEAAELEVRAWAARAALELRGAASAAARAAEAQQLGAKGVRDPAHPCEQYEPGEPLFAAGCETDGHYLCPGCRRAMREVAP